MARYGLVVGVAKYKSPLGNLSKTESDAKAVNDLLKQHGDFEDIQVLTGEVTSEQLDDALTRLMEQADKNEALIYFSGHAVVVKRTSNKTRGYLALSDTILKIKNGDLVGIDNAYELEDLSSLVGEANLSNLVVLLDSCHSEILLEQGKGFLQRNTVENTFKGMSKDYFLVSACRKFEEAYAMKSESYSIFTGAMLRGLARDRANDRGVVDASTMFGYVADQLRGSGQEAVSFGYGRALRIVDYRSVVAKSEVDETCPYVGLNAFDESTAQWFFGRETAFKRLMLKIEQSPFVFVVGVSGSGKSSLVKAKLIPEMKQRKYQVLLMKPWSNPIQKLKDVFAEILEETGTDVIEFEQRIDAEGLLAAITDLPKPILLVIDQFEEVFTVCSQVAERRKFIQMLVDVAQTQTADFVVVATMRIDFLADCTYANLDAIVNEQMVVISGMNEDELRDAISKPAETQGYQLSDGLLDAILQDIEAEPNCLPLLEFALQELWENRNRQQHRLSLYGYRQMDRLKGALNRHADSLYEKQSASGQEWMRRIFLKLVRTGKDAKDTRQRERRQVILDLAGDDGNARKEIERILKSLEGKSGRLLVASEENGVAIVDLAHEALMEGWQRFAVWRSQDRDLRRLGDRVKDAFDEWIIKDKLQDYLLPRSLIIQVNTNENELSEYLSEDQHEFYKISKEHENQKDIVLNWARTKPLLVEKIEKLQNSISINPLHKLLHSIQLIDENLQEQPNELLSIIQGSLLKSIQQFVDGNSPENIVSNESAFLDQQDSEKRKTNLVIAVCRDHDRTVRSVAFSPNGEMIVSGSADSYLRLWNLNGTMIGQPFRGHEDEVLAVAFSPNGEMIVSASEDKYLRLWNLEGNMIGLPFNGHSNAVKAVAFNRDSTTIASGSRDKTLCLWDLQGNLMQKPFEHENGVLSLDFSRDGRKLISCSANLLYLWNLQGVILRKFEAHTSTVRCISVSPDGKIIATGSDDKTIRLWDFEGNLISSPFRGHDAPVWSVSFSADGKTIVSGSDDKKIRLWDLQGKRIGLALDGHTGSVKSVIFSPIDNVIASGSVDKTLRIWHGGWQDWLEIACNRLRYHPVFKDPADDLAREACEVCRKYVWDKEKVEG